MPAEEVDVIWMVLAMACTGGPGAFEPSLDDCIETQLDEHTPERVIVEDDVVMSCRSRWHEEYHCFGGAGQPELRFPLLWHAWAPALGYPDGEHLDEYMGLVDVELPRMIVGPDSECLGWLNGYVFEDAPHPWDFEEYDQPLGNCTLELTELCACTEDMEPADESCLELVVP